MFDIIVLLVIAGFVWKGVRLGFIEAVGGIVGVIVGLLAAGRWWQLAADSLQPIFNNQWLATAVGWVLIFVLVNRLVALLFWFADKMFHIIAIIPFLQSINSLLGGLLGLVEGFFVIGSIISMMLLIPYGSSLQVNSNNSKFSRIFNFVGVYAQKLTPDSVKNWQKGLPFMEQLNKLKNTNINELNPFNGFADDVTDGLNYLQNQVKASGSLGTTTNRVNGSFDGTIPEDAFEPTPVK